MKTSFDINRLTNDGYLILPLSMSRLAENHGQSPQEIYNMIEYFSPKVETFSNDVIFLYTYGLYFNSMNIAFEERKKLNQQIINHSIALRNLISKKKKYIPNAFHYLSADYIILNSVYFGEYMHILQKQEKEDVAFQKEIKKDIMNREYNESNINFILEEIVIAHILRQHLVELPRTLVRNDTWRLIAYPGPHINGDLYQWKNKVLPQKDKINPYSSGQYDWNKKIYLDFSK